MKKITLTTIKSFIKKNKDQLFIEKKNEFDGMVDGIMPTEGGFKKAFESKTYSEYNLGLAGAWFVRNSRDYFTPFEDDQFKGFKVSNCCGSFILAVKK